MIVKTRSYVYVMSPFITASVVNGYPKKILIDATHARTVTEQWSNAGRHVDVVIA